MSKKISTALPWIVTAFASIVLAYGINLPLAGQHDWNSVMYANIARNHLRYGLLQTKLGMVTNFGSTPPGEPFGYFTHYPPLMPLLLTLSFAIFGIHDWSARLVPIISSLIMIFFMTKLTQKYWDNKIAIFTALFLAASPMLLYYSKIPVHETVVLGFTVFTIWAYANWQTTLHSKWYWLTVAGIVLSQLTSWSGFYLSAYLPIHAWLTNRSRSLPKKYLWLLVVIAPIIFILHNLHMYYLIGSQAQASLLEGVLFRLNLNKAAAMYQITPQKFIILQSRWMAVYFTRIMLVLTAIWGVTTVIQGVVKKRLNFQNSLILTLGIFGFTHNVVFRNLAYIHDYMLIYALPFFALASASSLAVIHQYLKKYLPASILVIMLIFFLFTTERMAYIKVLFATGKKNPAVNMGKAIYAHSDPFDQIVILSSSFMEYLDVFVRYYSDRNITATNQVNPEKLKQFQYAVLPFSHNTLSTADKTYLYTHYPNQTIPGGILFDLKSP